MTSISDVSGVTGVQGFRSLKSVIGLVWAFDSFALLRSVSACGQSKHQLTVDVLYWCRSEEGLIGHELADVVPRNHFHVERINQRADNVHEILHTACDAHIR
jgi:hypothetical protein